MAIFFVFVSIGSSYLPDLNCDFKVLIFLLDAILDFVAIFVIS